MNWWDLPGPTEFLAGLAERLRDGRSVALALPQVPVLDISTWVYRHLYGQFAVISVDSPPTEDPLKALTDALYLLPESWGTWSVGSLVSRMESNAIHVVDGVGAHNWDIWRRFLMDFEVASRSRAESDRPVILCLIRGIPKKKLQIAGAALELLTWEGVIDELDTMLYVDRELKARGSRKPYHSLLVRQIAAIALWDLELADHLLACNEDLLFDPVNLLGKVSAENKENTPSDTSWEAGGLAQFGSRPAVHSLRLAAEGDPKGELGMRIWSAQSAEIFPKIELRRREASSELAQYIKAPLQLDGSRVESLDELEIGALRHLVYKSGQRIQRSLAERVKRWADIRNKLAHLEPLTAAEAKDDTLYKGNGEAS